MTNALYYGDNLEVLREHIADEYVDLIYLDPPFNSQANYNVLFRSPSGEQSEAQIEAFEDTWHWTADAEQAFDEVMTSGNTDAAEMLRAMRSFLKENDMMAYLTMMAVRILELHRVLKPTGSLYLHCDPTASHYLKILLDVVFGAKNYVNEIAWKRSGRISSISKIFRRAHDVLFLYAKSGDYKFQTHYEEKSEAYLKKFSQLDERGQYRLAPLMASGVRNGETGQIWRGFDPNERGKSGMHWITKHEKLEKYVEQDLVEWPKKSGGVPQLKYYLDQSKGVTVPDIWTDIALINAMGNESLGYPTQKPVNLLERLISASSDEGDIILDPFCGCGTAVHAAQKLTRQWIGIDVTHLAISLVEKRLNDAFPGVDYEVHGTPKDLDGAKELAEADKYQFQWWAVSLVNAVPFGGKKKGADSGIDGLIYFKPDGKKTEKGIVSVKGGANVGVAMIRDLGHVVDREKTKIGVFITLAEPTGPMTTEAVKAGFYETEYGKFPKLQILTIADLFNGKKPEMPWIDPTAFKKATQEDISKQEDLPL